MAAVILLTAAVLLLCIFSDRLSGKIGVPALLIFMGIGILFGSDGLFKIPFEDYSFSADVCEAALIIIMFTGGFAVKWESAKTVAVKACLLSTVGVVITAAVTMLFCRFVLSFEWTESFLMGAVISSTDAASVFSVLRSKKLNLKNGIAPLLEVESGSNDPFSYMLTILALSASSGIRAGFVISTIFTQLVFGAAAGIITGLVTVQAVRRFKGYTDGFEYLLFIASALLAYSVPALLNGNGYLSVYIAGVIIGNSKIPKKGEAVTFLNGITGLCQIAVFFLLGLLSTPSTFPESFIPAAAVYICLTFLSRPVSVLILGDRKSSFKDLAFISLAGLRGASSIVFAIMAVVDGAEIKHNIFNIVFMVCIMSMLLQGSLLPAAAKKLGLIDENSDVLKTFNDYKEDESMTMMRMFVNEEHPWANMPLCDVNFPSGSLAVMIKRGNETVVPRGNTVILPGDNIILSVPPFEADKSVKLREIVIKNRHGWTGKKIRELELPDSLLIVMIKRGGESIIPSGATEIREGDIVAVTNTSDENDTVLNASAP